MVDPSAAPLDLEAIRQRHAAGYPLSVHIEQAFQDATADVAALLTAYSRQQELWREQDDALQAIFGACGSDVGISCPDDVAKLVAETLDESRAACVRLQAERDALRQALVKDGLRDAKYLNPACAVDGCQWLRAGVSDPPAWQPIATVPRDRRYVLVWQEDVGYWIYRFGPGLITEPDDIQWTHWRELPAPPVLAPTPPEQEKEL